MSRLDMRAVVFYYTQKIEVIHERLSIEQITRRFS